MLAYDGGAVGVTCNVLGMSKKDRDKRGDARSCAAFFLLAFALLACSQIVLPDFAHAVKSPTGGGTLQVRNVSGSSAEYEAALIATPEALPVEDGLAWTEVAGKSVGAHQAFPDYDPTASNAKAQGRALVEAVDEALAADEDGSLAQWLSGHVIPAPASAPRPRVVSGGSAVAVQDGWYLLTSPGRRPLAAWVEGAPVELWDKSDSPSVTLHVRTDQEWASSAVHGAGRTLAVRTVMTVPETYSLFTSYPCTLNVAWDEPLALVPDSARLELVPANGPAVDITALVELQAGSTSLVVRIADLCEAQAEPGDTIALTYEMNHDPLHAPGARGLDMQAHATFPTFTGTGETPVAKAKAYTSTLAVHAIAKDGKPLAGAVFALRGEAGEWLTAEGAFAGERSRVTWTTGEDGMAAIPQALGRGSYTLVQLENPAGHKPVRGFESAVKIDAEHDLDTLALTCEASGAAAVEQVDAGAAAATLVVEHDAEAQGGLLDKLPQTWDNLPPYAKFGLLALILGALIILLGRYAGRDGQERDAAARS